MNTMTPPRYITVGEIPELSSTKDHGNRKTLLSRLFKKSISRKVTEQPKKQKKTAALPASFFFSAAPAAAAGKQPLDRDSSFVSVKTTTTEETDVSRQRCEGKKNHRESFFGSTMGTNEEETEVRGQTAVLSSREEKKNVRFSSIVLHDALSRKDYTPGEIRASWYQQAEYSQMTENNNDWDKEATVLVILGLILFGFLRLTMDFVFWTIKWVSILLPHQNCALCTKVPL
jgi:hypothetical protein